MVFRQHISFKSESKSLRKAHASFDKDLETAKLLLSSHFEGDLATIKPGKIHHLKDIDDVEFWKYEMSMRELKKPNLWPRVWFGYDKSSNEIVFLCIHSHSDNYDTNSVDQQAYDRYTEIGNIGC